MSENPTIEKGAKPVPKGLPLAEFNRIAAEFGVRFRNEGKTKPSPRTYALVGAKPVKKVARCANSTFAGQLLVILADNGVYAERTQGNSAHLRITCTPWQKNTVTDAVSYFQRLR